MATVSNVVNGYRPVARSDQGARQRGHRRDGLQPQPVGPAPAPWANQVHRPGDPRAEQPVLRGAGRRGDRRGGPARLHRPCSTAPTASARRSWRSSTACAPRSSTASSSARHSSGGRTSRIGATACHSSRSASGSTMSPTTTSPSTISPRAGWRSSTWCRWGGGRIAFVGAQDSTGSPPACACRATPRVCGPRPGSRPATGRADPGFDRADGADGVAPPVAPVRSAGRRLRLQRPHRGRCHADGLRDGPTGPGRLGGGRL